MLEVVVSSGGMYNTAFPKWEDATCTGPTRQTVSFLVQGMTVSVNDLPSTRISSEPHHSMFSLRTIPGLARQQQV